LDFLVRIEPFQWVTLTPRPGISLLGSSPRNNGPRPLISRGRAPRGVRRRRLVCAVDRAFHGDQDHSTASDYRKELLTRFSVPHETEDTRLWKSRLWVRYGGVRYVTQPSFQRYGDTTVFTMLQAISSLSRDSHRPDRRFRQTPRRAGADASRMPVGAHRGKKGKDGCVTANGWGKKGKDGCVTANPQTGCVTANRSPQTLCHRKPCVTANPPQTNKEDGCVTVTRNP